MVGGGLGTREGFADEIQRRPFLTDSLNLFRQYPLLRLDENQALILDLQFLVELLTSGVYWKIHDSLPGAKRKHFKELWGRLFELYAVDLLGEFYPPTSQILTADLKYGDGQIDALLEFGPDVLVFEMKASLLTEPAKRLGDEAEFVRDFNLKFVRNERGKPKAVVQLVTSCKAIENGTVPTATRPARIYPVLVSDEPVVEAFCFNAYLNEIFQSELGSSTQVQPISATSINELEEMLPYVSQNAFSWRDLLGSRFNDGGVYPFSVHQAIYDWAQKNRIQPLRNQAIRKRFEQVWSIISSNYKTQS